MYVCICVYIYISICVYIPIYIYICTHTQVSCNSQADAMIFLMSGKVAPTIKNTTTHKNN